jgi:2-amino-4-hydroxy-6-hydroxymethyldihydropteridine diphosphokinase
VQRTRRVVIGIGSNLGDRAGNLALAVARLGEDARVDVLARSLVYVTPPAGGPPQGDYLNCAALVSTALPARELLLRTLAIEHALGRVRPDPVRWGPRTIDLDILWIEGEAIDEPGLTVPHPRLGERAFALRPLLDVVPDAVDPTTGARYADLPAARVPLVRADGT